MVQKHSTLYSLLFKTAGKHIKFKKVEVRSTKILKDKLLVHFWLICIVIDTTVALYLLYRVLGSNIILSWGEMYQWLKVI